MARSLVMRSAVIGLAMITALGMGAANAVPVMGASAPIAKAANAVKSENLIEVRRRYAGGGRGFYGGGRGFRGGYGFRGGRGYGGRYAYGGRRFYGGGYGYGGRRFYGGRYGYGYGRYGYGRPYGYGYGYRRAFYPGAAFALGTLGLIAGASYYCDPYYDYYCGPYGGFYGGY